MTFNREEGRLEPIAALVTAGALLMGSVACTEGQRPSFESEAATTSTTTDKQEAKSQVEKDWSEIVEDIRNIEFMATPEEYAAISNERNAHSEENSKTFLHNKGIELIVQDPDNPSVDEFWFASEIPVTTVADALALMPCRIVRASGLERVHYSKFLKGDDRNFKEPEHDNGEVFVRSGYELEAAIAAMILDKLPNKQQILAQYVTITEVAGARYDPNYVPVYGGDKPIPGFPDSYFDIFSGQEAMHSPRVEFILNFSRVIGLSTSIPLTDLEHIYSQKMQIAIDVFTDLVEYGDSLLRFRGYEFGYGTHGLHPLDNVTRIPELSEKLRRAKTKAEKDAVWRDEMDYAATDPHYSFDTILNIETPPQTTCKVNTVVIQPHDQV